MKNNDNPQLIEERHVELTANAILDEYDFMREIVDAIQDFPGYGKDEVIAEVTLAARSWISHLENESAPTEYLVINISTFLLFVEGAAKNNDPLSAIRSIFDALKVVLLESFDEKYEALPSDSFVRVSNEKLRNMVTLGSLIVWQHKAGGDGEKRTEPWMN